MAVSCTPLFWLLPVLTDPAYRIRGVHEPRPQPQKEKRDVKTFYLEEDSKLQLRNALLRVPAAMLWAKLNAFSLWIETVAPCSQWDHLHPKSGLAQQLRSICGRSQYPFEAQFSEVLWPRVTSANADSSIKPLPPPDTC